MVRKTQKSVAADKVLLEKRYLEIHYPMDNLAVINNGQCRLCEFSLEINATNDVDVLRAQYKTNHEVLDTVQAKLRMVYQDSETLAGAGNCTFKMSLKNNCFILTLKIHSEQSVATNLTLVLVLS